MATFGMMYIGYPARGGLVWGQMRGVLSEVRGVYTPVGGLYNILVVRHHHTAVVRGFQAALSTSDSYQ